MEDSRNEYFTTKSYFSTVSNSMRENYFFVLRTSCSFHCHCPYMINEVRQHLISGFSLFFMLWIMGAYALHFSNIEKRNVNYRKLLLFILLYLLRFYMLWISYHVHTNKEIVKGKYTSVEWLLQFQEFLLCLPLILQGVKIIWRHSIIEFLLHMPSNKMKWDSLSFIYL